VLDNAAVKVRHSVCNSINKGFLRRSKILKPSYSLASVFIADDEGQSESEVVYAVTRSREPQKYESILRSSVRGGILGHCGSSFRARVGKGTN
jgi:hypothetical protein